MARRIRYSELENRTARERLPAGKYRWRNLDPGRLALGYKRTRKAVAGTWLKRVYIGTDERGIGHYRTTQLGTADDFADADGVNVLNFSQAQIRARDQDKPASPITVRQAMADYIELLKGRGQSTNDTERRAAVHILPKLGEVQVEKLTSAQIRKWLADHATAPALVRSKKNGTRKVKAKPEDAESIRQRRSSANRVLTILKAGLNHAFDDNKVASNEAWGRRVKPFRGVDVARIRFLTIAEAQRLINASDQEFRPLVRAALETGARYSELARLQAQDFNPDAGTVHIRQTKSWKARHIILTDDGTEFFRDMTIGRAGNELIFIHENGSGWKASQQGRPMAAANERAKIMPPIGFHILRHTYCSHCVMNGMPLMVLAKNLGHADIGTIQKNYGHLSPSFITDAIRAGAPRYGVKTKSKVTPLRTR